MKIAITCMENTNYLLLMQITMGSPSVLITGYPKFSNFDYNVSENNSDDDANDFHGLNDFMRTKKGD